MKKVKQSVEKSEGMVYNKRKKLIFLSHTAKDKIKTYIGVFLAFVIVFTGAFNHLSSIFAVEEKLPEKPTIIIDPGHGGFDSGAVAQDGTYEKNLNLAIALKLKSQLLDLGCNIIITREKDEALKSNSEDSEAKKQEDLQKRVEIMNSQRDAIFISIHQNKFEQAGVRGLQVFYSDSEASQILAQSIQDEWNATLGRENPRVEKLDNRNVYVLKNATIPAVIVECGFISNSEELRLLKSEEYQYKISFTILSGILEYFNKQEK